MNKFHLGKYEPVWGFCGCGREAIEGGMCKRCRDEYLANAYGVKQVPFWEVVGGVLFAGLIVLAALYFKEKFHERSQTAGVGSRASAVVGLSDRPNKPGFVGEGAGR